MLAEGLNEGSRFTTDTGYRHDNLVHSFQQMNLTDQVVFRIS